MMDSESREPANRGAERTLALLRVVCEHAPLALSDAARRTGLSASTALRLLRTLDQEGYVRRTPEGHYRPGAALIRLGVLALEEESLVSLTAESMRRIVDQCAESVYLSIIASPHQGLYIAIQEGTRSVRHANWVGRQFPLSSSAAGQVLRGETGSSGYVVVGDGVEPDITAISCPLRMGDSVLGALSVVVPSYRVTQSSIERIAAVLMTEAQELMAIPGVETRP